MSKSVCRRSYNGWVDEAHEDQALLAVWKAKVGFNAATKLQPLSGMQDSATKANELSCIPERNYNLLTATYMHWLANLYAALILLAFHLLLHLSLECRKDCSYFNPFLAKRKQIACESIIIWKGLSNTLRMVCNSGEAPSEGRGCQRECGLHWSPK